MDAGPSPPRSLVRPALRAALAAVLTLALLVWFLRGVDLADLGTRILNVRVGPLLLALLFSLGHYLLRAWRWRFLLAPLGKPRYIDLLQSTVAGYAVNNVLPGRGGEVVRPLVLARRSGLPFSGALATVVLERLLDMVTVVVLFLVSAPLVLAGSNSTPDLLRRPLLLLALLAVLAVAGWLSFRFLRRPLRGAGGAVLARLPERFQDRARSATLSFLEGFSVLRRGRLLWWVALGSLAVWVDIALITYFTVRAFNVPFTLAGSFFLMGWLAVGISIPTPGGIGGFEAFGKECLVRFFGLAADLAAGIVLVLHAVSIVPITIWGLGVLMAEGIRPGQLRASPEAGPDDRIADGPATPS